MKKRFACAAALFALLVPMVIFAACGGGHEHVYRTETVAATCTEQAHTLHICDCGESYKDNYTGDYAPHTGSGSCSVCGLNYFNALAEFIEENGTKSGSQYVYTVQEQKDAQAVYDPAGASVAVETTLDMSDGSSMTVRLLMEDASGAYEWTMDLATSGSLHWQMGGSLTAAAFTSGTSSLRESWGDFPSSLVANSRKAAATLMDTNVRSLGSILMHEGSRLNVAFFGFANFL